MEFKRALNRLKKDVWALVSALYILGVCGIAVFAYQLAPDATRFANQMRLSIHSKPPGFSCHVLTIPRNAPREDSNFFTGSRNTNEEIPIEEIRWSEKEIAFKRYGNATDYFETISFTQFPKGTQRADIEQLYLQEKYFLFGT